MPRRYSDGPLGLRAKLTTRRTLEAWRLTGEGPTFRKLGARMVRYAPDDLTAFVEAGARLNTAGGTPWQGSGRCGRRVPETVLNAHTLLTRNPVGSRQTHLTYWNIWWTHLGSNQGPAD